MMSYIISTFGQVGRVMHSGVKYIDRNNSQPASVILKGATLSDIILPTDNVYYISGQYGGWREGNTQKEAINKAREIAINQKSEVLIHGENGKIREKKDRELPAHSANTW